MIDEFAKEYLHGDLRWTREALLWKLDGLSEYDVRRPLTPASRTARTPTSFSICACRRREKTRVRMP